MFKRRRGFNMSSNIKKKILREKQREKIEIVDLQTKKIDKHLNSLEDIGFLNYELKEGDKVDVQINAQAVVDYFKSLPNIPIPIEVYNNLKTVK